MILFLGFLAASLYQGEKHRRLITSLQDLFLDITFSTIGPKPFHSDKNVYHFKLNSHLDWGQKKTILNTLLDFSPSHFYIFNLENESSFKPGDRLFENLNKNENIALKTKVFVSFDPSKSVGFEPKVESWIKVLEGDPCEEGRQRICVYNSMWKRWMGQAVFEEFLDDKSISPLSENLQRVYPSYLLFFSKQAREDELKSLEKIRGKVVVLDLGSKGILRENKDEISSYFSQSDYLGSSFWSDVIRFLIQKDFVYVSTKLGVFFLGFISVCLLFFVVFFTSSYVSVLLVFLLFVFLFLLNILSVSFFRIYIPLADVFFLNFAFVFLFTYLKMSYLSYKRDFDLFRANKIYEMKKFRKIVISIISHNLNTPLAQVSGLLDIVYYADKKDKSYSHDLSTIQSSLALASLSVKVFLMIISLQNKRVNLALLDLKDFESFLKKELKLCLDPLGFKISFLYEQPENTNTFFASHSLLSSLILSFCYFFYFSGREVNIRIMMTTDGESSKDDIFINLISNQKISESFFSLDDNSLAPLVKEKEQLDKLIFRYIFAFKESYPLHYYYKKHKEGSYILSLKVSFKEKNM